MLRRMLITSFALFVLAWSRAAFGQNQTAANGEQTAPEPSAVEVPAGVVIPVELKNTIHSRSAYAGQDVYCVTNFPIAIEDKMLIPGGSYLKGIISKVVQPGRLTGKAQLVVRFDSLVLPNGITRPMSAKIVSLAGSKLEEPSEGAKDPGETIIDASILANTSLTQAASQGITGMMFSAATKDKSFALPSGMDMEIRLVSAVSIPLPPQIVKKQAPSAQEGDKTGSSDETKTDSKSSGNKKSTARRKSAPNNHK